MKRRAITYLKIQLWFGFSPQRGSRRCWLGHVGPCITASRDMGWLGDAEKRDRNFDRYSRALQYGGMAVLKTKVRARLIKNCFRVYPEHTNAPMLASAFPQVWTIASTSLTIS